MYPLLRPVSPYSAGYGRRYKKSLLPPLPPRRPPPPPLNRLRASSPLPPVSNEVKTEGFVPSKEVKGHSTPSANDKDSLETVTSALKANEEAFKGQLPESLRGAGEDIALVVDEDDQCEKRR